jgi:hypothetical protein
MSNERRRTHEELILDLLREADGGWVPCSTFAAFSRNHTARISGLRNNGCEIEYREVGDGATEYRLVREGGILGGQHQFICVFINGDLEIEHTHVTASDADSALRKSGFGFAVGAKAIPVSKSYKPPVEENLEVVA